MQCLLRHTGAVRNIYFLERSAGDCPAQEFWDGLDEDERGSLLVVLKYHADSLTFRNKEKFRPIEGTDFLEAKTRKGARLLCFFDGQDSDRHGRTIFVNGFKKGEKLADALARAANLRSAWLGLRQGSD